MFNIHERARGRYKKSFRLRESCRFRYDTCMKFIVSFLLLCVMVMSGCRVSDVREYTIRVPAMASDQDVARIRKALEPLNGVNKEKMVFDVPGRTVKLTYDSMVVAHKNLEIAIAEAGYDANSIPAVGAAPAK